MKIGWIVSSQNKQIQSYMMKKEVEEWLFFEKISGNSIKLINQSEHFEFL